MKGVGQGIVGSWCSVQWDTIYGCNLNTGGGSGWIFSPSRQRKRPWIWGPRPGDRLVRDQFAAPANDRMDASVMRLWRIAECDFKRPRLSNRYTVLLLNESRVAASFTVYISLVVAGECFVWFILIFLQSWRCTSCAGPCTAFHQVTEIHGRFVTRFRFGSDQWPRRASGAAAIGGMTALEGSRQLAD